MRLLVTLVGLCLIVLPSCSEAPVAIDVDPLLTSDQLEVVREVNLTYSDSMILRARVEGPKLIKYLDREDPREEFPEGVKVTFYEPDGQVTSTLVANYGIRRARDHRIQAIGDVVFTSVEGEQLETEELIWDDQREVVFTKKFVLITTPEEKVWGMGFEANQNFTRRRILAPEGRVLVDAPSE